MIELKSGCHYFLAIQLGAFNDNDLDAIRDAWAKAGIFVHVLRLYSKPTDCMAFTEKQELVA